MASTYLFYALLLLNSQHIIGRNELPGAAEKYWKDKLANIPMPQGLHELLVTDRHDVHYWHVDGSANPVVDGNKNYALSAGRDGLSKGNHGYAFSAEKDVLKANSVVEGPANPVVDGNKNYALPAGKDGISKGNHGYAFSAEKDVLEANLVVDGNKNYALPAGKDGLSKGNHGYAFSAEKDVLEANPIIDGNKNYALPAGKDGLSKGNHGYAFSAEKDVFEANPVVDGNKNYALPAGKNDLSKGNHGYAFSAEKDVHEANPVIDGNKNYALPAGKDGLSKGNHGYALSAEKDVLDSIKNVTTYFLLEDFLRPKMKFWLPKSRPKNLARFLPRNVAHSFSFSSKNLTPILKRLSISPHSSEAKRIQNVLEGCETGLAVEHRKCVTSLEDMVDFALIYTGSKNVGVYQNEIMVEGEAEEFAVGRAKMVGRKVVVCHKDMFPHAVYYCHNLEGTMGFEASLLGLRKGAKGGKVMVACHSETSTWNPRHLAFQVLKIKPGEGTICHVIDDNSIMWASP